LEKSVRRRFTAPYKLRILEQADACRQSGQLGALLRREGLYASLLASWRRQRDALVDALKDPNVDVRYQAALALSLGVAIPNGNITQDPANIRDWPGVVTVLIAAEQEDDPRRVVQMSWQVT
jgi:transposase-like protein